MKVEIEALPQHKKPPNRELFTVLLFLSFHKSAPVSLGQLDCRVTRRTQIIRDIVIHIRLFHLAGFHIFHRAQEPDILILGIRRAMIPFDIIQKVNDRPEIL